MASEKESEEQQQEQPQQEQTGAANNQQQQSPTAGQPATENAASEAAPASPQQSQRPRPTARKTDYEQDVVYLYQFTRSPVVGPSVSPFCVKVETWLRVAGLKYENVDHRMKFKSKKGQLPFVELNGAEIADSDVIVKQLGQHFDKDLDAGLTAAQRSVSHAFVVMLDHHTGWIYRWWRYNYPAKFMKSTKLNIQHMLNSRIPTAILNFAFKLKFKGKKKSAVSQGIGVHSADEIYDFGKEDLLALNQLIGDKQFFFGDEPTLLDCVAFAHLVQFLYVVEVEFPPKTFLESECPQLLALVERIKERFWPDWEEMCQSLDLNTHLPKTKKKGEDEADDESEEKKDKEADKEKTGSATDEHDRDSEPEKEKVEKDEKEKEKKELDEDNKKKDGGQEENKKE